MVENIQILRCINSCVTIIFHFISAPSCDAPKMPKFAYLTLARGADSKYLNGEKVYYSCRAGYELLGIPEIECGEGVWTEIRFGCKGT